MIDYVDTTPALPLKLWLIIMEDKHITIKDIIKMNIGESKKLLCLDRNFYDFINNTNKPINAKDFFKYNYIVEYTHKNNLKGTLKYLGDWSDNKPQMFNFDLEYIKNHWYPLNNDGNLPINDLQGFAKFPWSKDKIKPVSWKDYSTNTRVGWRGPMILWEDVCNSPKIIFKESCDY